MSGVRLALLKANASQIRALTNRRRAANARVFGSVLRNEDRENSDIDIIVDPLPGATLFDLGGLQMDLEDFLNVRVDLVTPGDIAPAFRDRVLADAQPI